MKDPFPWSPPPPWFQAYFEPLARKLNFATLPLHAHEVIFSVALYTTIHLVVAPVLSRLLIPKRYAAFDARTRVNWDVHIVSQFQSIIICALALWVILCDEERSSGDWQERIWGYTGTGGLLTAMACGYFIWDLFITSRYVKIFGWGMLAHAISAVSVFSLGFRPYVNYYSPVFILYELSTPLNNVHWFLDKLQMTGSRLQWINGILLIATFFSCRLIWGTGNSIRVFYDMFTAYRSGAVTTDGSTDPHAFGKPAGGYPGEESMFRFTQTKSVPLWLVASYLAANITLNSLNFYWMNRMVATVRSRFDPPFGTKGVVKSRKSKAGADGVKREEPVSSSGVSSSGRQVLEVEGKETRTRRRG